MSAFRSFPFLRCEDYLQGIGRHEWEGFRERLRSIQSAVSLEVAVVWSCVCSLFLNATTDA